MPTSVGHGCKATLSTRCMSWSFNLKFKSCGVIRCAMPDILHILSWPARHRRAHLFLMIVLLLWGINLSRWCLSPDWMPWLCHDPSSSWQDRWHRSFHHTPEEPSEVWESCWTPLRHRSPHSGCRPSSSGIPRYHCRGLPCTDHSRTGTPGSCRRCPWVGHWLLHRNALARQRRRSLAEKLQLLTACAEVPVAEGVEVAAHEPPSNDNVLTALAYWLEGGCETKLDLKQCVPDFLAEAVARVGKHRSARVTRPNVSLQEEMFLRIAFCLVSLSVVYFQNQEVNVAMLSCVMMCENDRVLPVQVFAAMCGCLREWIVKRLGGCAWASAYRFTSVTRLFVGSPSFGLLCPKEHVEGKLLRNDQIQIAFIVKMCNGTHANLVTSLNQRSKR